MCNELSQYTWTHWMCSEVRGFVNVTAPQERSRFQSAKHCNSFFFGGGELLGGESGGGGAKSTRVNVQNANCGKPFLSLTPLVVFLFGYVCLCINEWELAAACVFICAMNYCHSEIQCQTMITIVIYDNSNLFRVAHNGLRNNGGISFSLVFKW